MSGTANSNLQAPLNRRDFIWLTATALTGLAGGGSLAWGRQRDQAAELAEQEVAILIDTLNNSGANLVNSDSALAAAQNLIAKLADELGNARTETAGYLSQLGDAETELTGMRAEITRLRGQLTDTENQNTVLADLLTLYEALEDEGLDIIIQTGLAALAGVWGSLNTIVSLLQSGIIVVGDILDNFVQRLITLRNNLLRVLPMTTSLSNQVTSIEDSADETVDENSAALDPVTRFVNFVLDNLPFGIGNRVKEAMTLIGELLSIIPDTLLELQQRVLTPFDEHLDATGDKGWLQTVVTPVRERVLGPAVSLLDAVAETDTTMTTELIDPVNATLNRRGALHDKSSRYKAEHNLV